MAIRRNMGFPLAESKFDTNPPKKKSTTKKKKSSASSIINDNSLTKSQKSAALQSHINSLKKGGFTKEANAAAKLLVKANNEGKLQ